MKGFGGDHNNSKKKNYKQSKPSKEELIEIAIKLHLQGKISEAAKNYQKLINNGFKHQIVFSNYGIILRDIGNLKDAELYTRKAIELNPNFVNAHLNLGNILKDLGNLKDAELSTRKAIELKPNYADAYFNLGNILKDLGNLKDAELSTRKAIELNPNFVNAHLNLGNILKDLGNLKDAELSTRKAIELNPNFVNAHLNLGNILKGLGNLKDAELSTRKAIELNPNYADAYFNLGNILKDLGNLKDAELSTRKAIELNPNYADAYFNLGNILKDLGNLKDAELSTRKAIELKPDFADANCNLGVILHELGNLEEAELSTRKAIELKPDFADANCNLGSILYDLGNLEEAELYTREAIKLKPDFANAHSNLGDILKDLGHIEELISFSKSTLKSKNINQGCKLRALINITIAYLLQRNFLEFSNTIKKINELKNQGVINTIENQINKKHAATFSTFISSLYPLLEKDNKVSYAKSIPHIGESHCLSFSHQILTIESQYHKIQPVLITGGKAWHFANNKSNRWKSSLNKQIKKHINSDIVFISFGEIDCRKDEGILIYAINKHKNLLKVCEKTINGYLNHMEKILSPHFSKRYYFGVPAPTMLKKIPDELDIKRIEMIKIYNSFLKANVLSMGCFFVDVYQLTADKIGKNNKIYMSDNTHLSPKSLTMLLKYHLHKP